MMLFFIGGVRSGKSRLAQQWAEASAPKRLYIATCQPRDEEMARRVANHKARRGTAWNCIEEPLDPLAALNNFLCRNPEFNGSILLDCLSMWLANMLLDKMTEKAIIARAREFIAHTAKLNLPFALVSAECGLGFVPNNAISRSYGDMLGDMNQIMAKAADSVIFAACGLPLALKGSLPAFLKNSNQ